MPEFAADPQHDVPTPTKDSGAKGRPANNLSPIPSKFKRKAQRRFLARQLKRHAATADAALIEDYIEWAEDERTALAKLNTADPKFAAVERAHDKYRHKHSSLFHKVKNFGFDVQTKAKRIMQKWLDKRPHVRFHPTTQVRTFDINDTALTVTYDSGADGHYISERDRERAGLPILRRSTKRVGVADGSVCLGNNVTRLPVPELEQHATEADTFDAFPHSLMSVGKTSDAGTISIFTKDGVSVHNEEDVLITCKGKPILVGVRDERGRYRIPLVQKRGQWRPRRPTSRARRRLLQANSVYDLPTTEQAIKWMHAVCGYPVKSTWLAAVKAGNFVGWPLLTTRNVEKYYPETTETPKGHMNQTRKNVRSTKPRRQPLEVCDTSQLRGKKERDIYAKVYDVKETIYSDQTGQFPTRSLSGNKYIMVMVDIDSSGILVEPMKSRKDAEMMRAYKTLLQRLHRANIVPRKHVLDNEVSDSMKEFIRSTHGMELELVPPGCHRRNAAEVAIRNFKAHFLSILAGVADDFPKDLWDRLLPQAEITINLLRQSNATPTVSAYAHLSGPFDYNKMPLAPMGCKVQVHEKTDKRGTWAFHSLDGWYLSTSPEHYRTHKCHIKTTRSDRFSDTVQFQHKNITNPTITHYDKVMHALADCAKAIKNIKNIDPNQELRDIQRLLSELPDNERDAPARGTQAVPRVRPLPRVDEVPTNNTDRRVTRSMNQGQPNPVQPDPRVDTVRTTPSTPPSALRRKRRRVERTPVPATAPANNTRSKTRAAARIAAPPATNTRAAAALRKHAERMASAKKKPPPRRLSRRLARLENEVHQALAVMDKQTGKMLNYRQLMRHPFYKKAWSLSSANEFGRLANGVGGRIKNPTNTIKFIRKDDVPLDRRKDVTYGQFVCTVRPEKAESNRTRFTVGGDRINYPGEVATPTAEMLVAKLLFNSVISTKGAKFMTMDISNFYLMTPLKRPEYIRMKLSDIPDEIIDEYKLRDIATPDGSVYIEANKGMYGLPQAGLLANELLEKRLNEAGYRQSKLVPGLWKHDWRPIQFTLVVDDFGVKYVGEQHAKHLKHTLEQHYKVTTDWTGRRYIGITLDWDYVRRQVHLSMPGYVAKALKQFQHIAPKRKQNAPFPSAKIEYGAKQQFVKQDKPSPPLNKKGKRFIQQVCGKFLFLGRAVDSTLLCPISAIASQSANPTEETMKHTKQLLDYVASQDEAVLTYNASEMKLAAHSDASYLSEPKARSRAGGHFFLSNGADIPPNNGAVLNIAHVIKHVMSSATEAELAALYIMAREAVYIRIILEEMGHPQPATPLQTDNAMADGVINGKVMPKRTKAMDMRFHWLRDRECQEQFRIYWRPGKLNYADYWTKHHPAKHHQNIRREFLTPQLAVEMLRLEQSRTAQAAAAA